MEEREQSIGAIWKNTDKRGKDYFNGSITVEGQKVDFIIFPNGTKDSGNPEHKKKPDFKIFKRRQQT